MSTNKLLKKSVQDFFNHASQKCDFYLASFFKHWCVCNMAVAPSTAPQAVEKLVFQQPAKTIPSLLAVFAACALWLGVAGLGQAMPPIQQWETPNGARVYFVPAPELPMLDVRVVFDAGSARDAAHPGLANLTNALLSAGSADADADAIAARLEDTGAQYGNGVERDMAWVSLRTLADMRYRQPALRVFGQIVTQPSLPEAAFARELKRMQVALRQAQQSPETVAEWAFYQALYGRHPYAHPPEGTAHGLSGVRYGDVQDFYRRYYSARNAVIALVGAVSRAQAETIARDLAAGLPECAAADILPSVAPLAAATSRHIAHPSTQTHVLVGAPGISRDDPDYFALYVGNHAFGGSGLTSKISEEIREKRGLSYSAYSYFLPMRRPGPLQIGLQTRNNQTATALVVLNDTLRTFINDGITEQQLHAAQQNITGGFPLRIDSNKNIVGYIAMIGFYQLPLDYLERFTARVQAVSVAAVREAFKRRVNPERLVTVMVGGPADAPAEMPKTPLK